MKFECKDLERALAVPELMGEAREHARDCTACRSRLWLWREISNVAPQLRKDWESPDLWPRIREAIENEKNSKAAVRPMWHWAAAAAAVIVVAAGMALVIAGRPGRQQLVRDFLTEQALEDVQCSEAAYVKSIERLSQVITPRLREEASPLATSYREKLVVLDAAIKEMGATVNQNPYNAYLRTELAALYREKQKTLQELLQRAEPN